MKEKGVLNKIITIFIIVLLLLPSDFIYSAPSINNTTGTIAHGNALVITGSSFGVKTNAAPLKWETFEDGTLGQAITTTSYWSAETGDNTTFVTERNRNDNSIQLAKHHVVYGVSNKIFYKTVSEWATSGKVFVSYWVNYDFVSGDDQWQYKADRIEGETLHGTPPLLIRTQWFNTQYPTQTSSNYLELYDSEMDALGGDVNGEGDNLHTIVENKWINVNFIYQMSDANTSNGNFYFYQSHPDASSPYAKRYNLSCQTNTGG